MKNKNINLFKTEKKNISKYLFENTENVFYIKFITIWPILAKNIANFSIMVIKHRVWKSVCLINKIFSYKKV